MGMLKILILATTMATAVSTATPSHADFLFPGVLMIGSDMTHRARESMLIAATPSGVYEAFIEPSQLT